MDADGKQLDFNFAADDLLEFPRNLGEEGHYLFLSEQQHAIRALAEKFGIALNQRVRLRLVGWDEEFEGKLMLDSLIVLPLSEKTIRLRLGRLTFDNTHIERCRTID